MDEYEFDTQLQMVWPARRLNAPPAVRLPARYALRTYRRGDEARFFEVMELAGWPGWDEEQLRPWLPRILPEGWFVAIYEPRKEIVATAMALQSEAYHDAGELGWVAGDPAHAGQGLGMAVSAAATMHCIAAGCDKIHLYTEDFRLAALKTYLKLGYVPYLYAPDMRARWRTICEQLHWPFTPDVWVSQTSCYDER